MLATGATLSVREVPPCERRALQDRGLLPPVLPRSESSLVLVVTDVDGAFAGRWFALDAVVLEGLFIPETHRKRPGVARRLLTGMLDRLRAKQIREVVTLITDPAVERLAEKAGFVPLDGRVWKKEL